MSVTFIRFRYAFIIFKAEMLHNVVRVFILSEIFNFFSHAKALKAWLSIVLWFLGHILSLFILSHLFRFFLCILTMHLMMRILTAEKRKLRQLIFGYSVEPIPSSISHLHIPCLYIGLHIHVFILRRCFL